MNTQKDKWKFLASIKDKDLKDFLSSYNKDKNKDTKEVFEINKSKEEYRIELYNYNTSSKEKTKISYIDFLSDFSIYVECIGKKSKKFSSNFLTRELIKLFITKFGDKYVKAYLEDYKIKIQQMDEKTFFALFEIRTFASINLANNDKYYNEAKKLNEEVSNQTKQILDALFKETETELNSMLKEIKNNKF